MPVRRSTVAGSVLACALALAGLAAPAGAISLTEFPLVVPGSSPLGIAPGSDGNIWFTEVAGSRIGRVTPAGSVTDFSTGSGVSTDSRPWGIAPGPDGNLWFTEESGNRIGRFTPPATAVEFPLPAAGGPRGITAGPDGSIWVAEDVGRIARVTPAGAITEFSAGITAGARPLGIAGGPDGNVWFTEQAGRIGRITPAGAITEFSAGISANSLPSGIVAGPDGNMWFTEYTGDRVGRITPAGAVTEFSNGITAGAQIRSITVGPDRNLWFTEENGNRIGRITTAGVVTEYPSTLAPGGRPLEITAGPTRDLWITTGSGNSIARVRLDPAILTAAASGVTTAAATIAGTIDPFSSATSYVIEYGRTTAYGSATASRTIPPSPAAVPVTVPVTRLASGTLYHYRLVASSAGGTTRGPDRAFTTGGSPDPVGGGPQTGDRTAPRVGIAGAALVARNGRVTISLRCPLAETLGCRGTVRLVTVPRRGGAGRARIPLRLGRAVVRIGGGQVTPVTIRLSRRARALVRNRARLRIRAIVVAVDAAGNQGTTIRRLVLRRPAAR